MQKPLVEITKTYGEKGMPPRKFNLLLTEDEA